MAVADDKGIQMQHYNFVTIADIAKVEPKKTVDVMAIVEVSPDFRHSELVVRADDHLPLAQGQRDEAQAAHHHRQHQ